MKLQEVLESGTVTADELNALWAEQMQNGRTWDDINQWMKHVCDMQHNILVKRLSKVSIEAWKN
jgi:nucleoside 2-deoxyribosyltransferase